MAVSNQKNVCVIILGDIGRSPRMQYHSISLAEEGHKVDIVGYRGAPVVDLLANKPLVSFHYLNPYPNIACPKLLNYIFKTIWQALSLLFVLFIIRKPDFLILQNPPAIPSFIICYIYKKLARAKLIIDWHNYAYTIMALNVGQKNILVKLTHRIEEIFGRRADFNFCVTKAMKDDLKQNWGITATTLYDRPPEMFRSITIEEKHEVLSCLGLKFKELLSEIDSGTVFTESMEDGSAKLRNRRPGLIISSTSWTEDEDFSILLRALQEYENHCCSGNEKNLPDLICIITGKGPLKDYYCEKMDRNNWRHVKVITPWLEAKDYPLLLASADLGVCLHTSSSGLDLPMKVVDMFGCGLPVCAYKFKCLNELVKDNVNGYIFNDDEELSNQIQNWFNNFPNNQKQTEIRENFVSELEHFQSLRWSENWKLVVAPLFD